MDQPEGYVKKGHETKVCRLIKTLYGLKQSPREWNATLVQYLLSIGFTQAPGDACLFVRGSLESKSVTLVYVHVDDLAITGTNIMSFKEEMKKRFKMDDQGLAHFVVGIQVVRNEATGSLSLSQKHFVETVLARFGLQDCKPVATPLPPHTKLVRGTEEEIKHFSCYKVNRRCVREIRNCFPCPKNYHKKPPTYTPERPSSPHRSISPNIP